MKPNKRKKYNTMYKIRKSRPTLSVTGKSWSQWWYLKPDFDASLIHISEARYSHEILVLISPVATHWEQNQGAHYCYFHCQEEKERRLLIIQDRGVNDASSIFLQLCQFFTLIALLRFASLFSPRCCIHPPRPSFLLAHPSSSSLHKNPFFTEFNKCVTDRPTNGLTNGRTNGRTRLLIEIWGHI